MKRHVWIWCILGTVLALSFPAAAQVEMARSVVGSGCGASSGASYTISGSTLGQPAIGFMSGSSYTHDVGFWFPAWLLTPVAREEFTPPLEYRLGPNRPNPFNPVTTLEFSIPKRSRVTMKVYDVNGREVMTVLDEHLDPGHHTRVLDAEGLSSGIYFCRMVAGRFVESRKLVLLK